MAILTEGAICLKIILLLSLLEGLAASDVQVVTTENFNAVLEGEWMLEFYAPWCPACKQFSSTWEEFASWATEREGDHAIKVGKVDVTAQTMLSGQFMVTHLPSIFHIKGGQVRWYQEGRSLDQLKDYIDLMTWEEQVPIPWWRSPTAVHMKAVGTIFWFSEKAKELQVILEETYELPTFAVFVIIAVITIVVGLSLGGVTVLCIEVCLRFCSRKQAAPTKPKTETAEKDENASESHKDVKTSEAEKKSGTDGSSARKRKKDKKQGSSSEDKGQST